MEVVVEVVVEMKVEEKEKVAETAVVAAEVEPAARRWRRTSMGASTPYV